MLYHLFSQLSNSISGFNVAKYITFRAGIGFLFSFILSFFIYPWFIDMLRRKKLGQTIRDDGPKSHFSKAGTPTMGGAVILFTLLFPSLLWVDLTNIYFWAVVAITVGFGLIGFTDDYLKWSKKNSKGLSGRKKLIGQFAISTIVVALTVHFTDDPRMLHFPFLKNYQLYLGDFYIVLAVLTIVGSSNAVNLTDGLDGLAIGPIMTTAATLCILAYVTGHKYIAGYLNYPHIANSGELAIFLACLVGAGLGFLWYNSYPAQIFMGDVGSLPIGGALGAVAVFTKHEIILAIVGGMFVVSALSVIAQVASFKLTGKRVLRMAPIHHHFELMGWPENKVIVRFWIISIILAIVGLLTLKIR